MATQSPFPFLDTLFERLRSGLQPPLWMIEEVQRRLVLLINHVLMQEPEARARLTRQAGRVVEARWRAFVVRLSATPAGLLDLASSAATPDLTLTLVEESAWELAQAALRGDKPPVRIAGDVQFAAEINWLVEHVRWDLEEDIARVIGDAPAHAMGEAGRKMVQALRQFTRPAPDAAPAGTAGTPPTPTAGPGPANAANSGQATSPGSGQA